MYFAFYNDDYESNGGIGIEEFTTSEEALTFINNRISQDTTRHLDDYVLIEGYELKLKVQTRISSVAIDGRK